MAREETGIVGRCVGRKFQLDTGGLSRVKNHIAAAGPATFFTPFPRGDAPPLERVEGAVHPISKPQTLNELWSEPDRRRSPRIPWRIPVIATWNPSDTVERVTVREHGETLDISAHGVLVKLQSNLARGYQVNLLSPGGKVVLSGRVVRNLGTENDGMTRLGVEMDLSSIEPWVQMAY